MLVKQVRVLVLRVAGTNREHDMAQAWQMAGAQVEIKHLNELVGQDATAHLDDFAILGLPGGFAHGDDLGAGKLLANELLFRLGDDFNRFVESGRAVLGVCNGFQALAKTGVFGKVTLQPNLNGKFECRWVHLSVGDSHSPLLEGVETLYVPLAHGEGRIELADDQARQDLDQNRQVALRYSDANGLPTSQYPLNPNGSAGSIAGLTNVAGNVLGLMPHPENHILPHQHPHWTRLPAEQRHQEGDGLILFQNAVKYAAR